MENARKDFLLGERSVHLFQVTRKVMLDGATSA